jgi:cytochrome c-type biogenesis protein CcmH
MIGRNWISWLLGCSLSVIVSVIDPVLADRNMDAVAEEVFGSINSPFCKGRLLRDCPSSGASELKEEIRQKATEGKSAQQIVDELYSSYGDEIRAVPDDSAVGSAAWIAPPLFLLMGGLILVLWIRRNMAHQRANE